MGVFFSVLERSGRNKQPRMPIFLPEYQPSVAVSFKLIRKYFFVTRIFFFVHFVFKHLGDLVSPYQCPW